jgi:cytochrome oxidase Cu insertion factor (SCO1/SenC/PrrC family)
MKKLLLINLILVVLIAACSLQQSSPAPMVGSAGLDFTLDDALGGQTSLSDFDGKPVLLYFHMAVG